MRPQLVFILFIVVVWPGSVRAEHTAAVAEDRCRSELLLLAQSELLAEASAANAPRLSKAATKFSDLMPLPQNLSAEEKLSILRKDWHMQNDFVGQFTGTSLRATIIERPGTANPREAQAINETFAALQTMDPNELIAKGFLWDNKIQMASTRSNFLIRKELGIFGKISVGERIAAIHQVEKRIRSRESFLRYLLDHGVTVKEVADRTGMSLGLIYKWTTTNRIPDYAVLYFEKIYADLKDPEHFRNRIPREALAAREELRQHSLEKARELFPMMRDLLQTPGDIVDVFTPVRGKYPGYPVEAIHDWIFRSIPLTPEQLDQIVNLSQTKTTRELLALRDAHIDRLMLMEHPLDTNVSLATNLKREGEGALRELNESLGTQYRPIDLVNLLSRHRINATQKSDGRLMQTEVGHLIGIEPRTLISWRQGLGIPDYAVPGLAKLYRALHEKNTDRVAELLDVSEKRAELILRDDY